MKNKNINEIVKRNEKDLNGNGIDDEVETQLHVRHSSRKYNITKYVIALFTLLLVYACYREWLDLIPAVCGWLVGIVSAYCGLNIAQRKVDHDNERR